MIYKYNVLSAKKPSSTMAVSCLVTSGLKCWLHKSNLMSVSKLLDKVLESWFKMIGRWRLEVTCSTGVPVAHVTLLHLSYTRCGRGHW